MTKFTNEELISHKNANAEIRGNYTKCAKEQYREREKVLKKSEANRKNAAKVEDAKNVECKVDETKELDGV